MRQQRYLPCLDTAARSEAIATEVDLAFLQEFLGEGIDTDEALQPTDDLMSPDDPDLRFVKLLTIVLGDSLHDSV